MFYFNYMVNFKYVTVYYCILLYNSVRHRSVDKAILNASMQYICVRTLDTCGSRLAAKLKC